MVEITDELVEEFAKLLPVGRPTTEEEMAAQAAQSKVKDEWLKAKAKEFGLEGTGRLEKDLKKAMKKRKGKKKGGSAPTPGTAPASDSKAKSNSKENDKEKTGSKEDSSGKDLDEMLRKILGKPSENHGRGDFYVNSDDSLKHHLENTKGKYQTRFPPEPNGYLHIGHAKAMSVNFGIAKANDGNCYLRFDDTNPEAEKQEYIDGIIENVEWLGHKPFKVTYTSDYFDKLYELACELIKKGLAYVCFMSGEQVKAQRQALIDYNLALGERESKISKGENPDPVPFPTKETYDESRERSPEENLVMFEKMRQGRFAEGECTLRMKGDFTHKNPNMWDHMAYRIMFSEHPKTGDKWCIYPTYDFSHCLVDSLENITHSLCTLEFESRQYKNSSYHWLLHVLDMYHPKTWESSRCSISHNVMSKRRLQRLVKEGYVNGWDDPRLLTLAGLRRRGYTPASINTFCREIGVARSSNEVCVSTRLLESCIRSELDHSAPRRFAVIDPVKVVISNFDEFGLTSVTVPNHPAKGREDMGSRQVPFTGTVYIPREKFRLDMVKGYKGMVPGSPKNNSIRLLNAAMITYESHESDADGKVTCIKVTVDKSENAPKGISNVTWVPENALDVRGRFYDRLFKDCEIDGADVHAEKAASEIKKKTGNPDFDFVDLFNKDSFHEEQILVEPGLKEEHDINNRWQFITVGYFCIDRVDSTVEKPVVNLIVSLKEDKSKAESLKAK